AATAVVLIGLLNISSVGAFSSSMSHQSGNPAIHHDASRWQHPTHQSTIINTNNRAPLTSLRAVAVADDLTSSDRMGSSKKSIRKRVQDFVSRQKTKSLNVLEVSDVDMLSYIVQNNDGLGSNSKLHCLMFHAPFCKACHASLPLFQRMAKKFGRRKADVQFLSVAVTRENSQLLQEKFGVTKFPTCQIRNQDGLIEEQPVLKKLFKQFEERLHSVVRSYRATK
ncbi:MAG: hypothetical protein SGARI_005394, partial [Bacillariaceae sp.]